MQAWILQVMGQYGALGIFFLIFIENVFPPIPSEVILAFGGFMTLQTTLSVQSVILAQRWALWRVRWCCMVRGAGWGKRG